MTARKIFVVIVVMLTLLAGCAASQGGLFGRNKVDQERKAKLAERVRLLDIDWEILLKDNPPKADTVAFRTSISDAHKAITDDRLDDAEKEIITAEQWMAEARPRYYRDHETSVVAGTAKELSSSLMAVALSLKEKGVTARDAKDQAAADRYLQGAIEEGELAVIAAGRSGEGPAGLFRLTEQMGTIYTAAGHPERSAQLRGRIVKSLQAGIDITAKDIESRLRNEAPGYEIALLKDNKEAVSKAIDDLYQLNEKFKKQVADAKAFAPGEIIFKDYTDAIGRKAEEWQAFHAGPVWTPTVHHGGTDDESIKVCEANRQSHNNLKKGAQGMAGSGILLEETQITIVGEKVVVYGKIQNLRTTPILNPRVTVTGNAMSNIADLGYASMPPTHSTTFALTLECFNVEAYNRAGSRIPDHQLLLIFKEPNGTERKLILPVGVRSGG